MPLPSSGPIRLGTAPSSTISSINTEFTPNKTTGPYPISDYYRGQVAPDGTIYVLNTVENQNIPTSGAISWSNFYAAQGKWVASYSVNGYYGDAGVLDIQLPSEGDYYIRVRMVGGGGGSGGDGGTADQTTYNVRMSGQDGGYYEIFHKIKVLDPINARIRLVAGGGGAPGFNVGTENAPGGQGGASGNYYRGGKGGNGSGPAAGPAGGGGGGGGGASSVLYYYNGLSDPNYILLSIAPGGSGGGGAGGTAGTDRLAYSLRNYPPPPLRGELTTAAKDTIEGVEINGPANRFVPVTSNGELISGSGPGYRANASVGLNGLSASEPAALAAFYPTIEGLTGGPFTNGGGGGAGSPNGLSGGLGDYAFLLTSDLGAPERHWLRLLDGGQYKWRPAIGWPGTGGSQGYFVYDVSSTYGSRNLATMGSTSSVPNPPAGANDWSTNTWGSRGELSPTYAPNGTPVPRHGWPGRVIVTISNRSTF